MTGHCDVETFSAYLDRELPRQRAHEVEEHIRVCTPCRLELEGLERLAGRLRSLERLAPPSTIGLAMERRVALDGPRRARRFGVARAAESEGLQPSLQVVFALVIAFGAILLLLGDALDRSRRATIPVSLEAPAGEIAEAPRWLEVAGRRLELVEGVWWQDGLAGRGVESAVAVGTPDWDELVAAWPEVATLGTLGGPVVVEVEGRVVRLEPVP